MATGLPGVDVRAAEVPPWTASLGIEETLTNNVNLDPGDIRKGDLVTQLTPAVTIASKGAHANLNGSIALPILLYAKTGAENNKVDPQVNLTGNAELVERFFYVDGAVSVTQQFLTPFGAQPNNLANATQNRYTSQLYRVSPYIKGDVAGGLHYELRDDNIWSLLNNTPSSVAGVPVNAQNSYTNQLIGHLTRDPQPYGWQADLNRSDVRFQDQQGSQLQELGRLRLLYQPDGVLQLGLSGGYEHNDFPLTTYRGAIYGAGYKWHPTPTLSSEGFWEHRYFGSSYGFKLDYRSPLSVLTADVSRNTTSYPQQLATLPAGDVATLLGTLFSSRFPDPAQRQQFIDDLIRNRGLPSSLANPVVLYTQQTTLQEAANVTLGLIGARNSVFVAGNYLRSQPIAGSGEALPVALSGLNDNTQFGTNVTWNHQLTPSLNLGVNASWSRTIPKAPIVVIGEDAALAATTVTSVNVFLSMPVSPTASLFGGARYQAQASNVPSNAFNEAAAFVGLRYTFH